MSGSTSATAPPDPFTNPAEHGVISGEPAETPQAPLLPGLFLHDIVDIAPPEAARLSDVPTPADSSTAEGIPAPTAIRAAPATIYIDPTATAPGDGSLAAPFRSWSEVTWHDGTTYLQKAGTAYTGNIVVSGADITLGGYGEGQPILVGSLVFDGAQRGALTSFAITGSDYAGVALTHGATAVTISGNTITGNAGGIWLSQSVGGDNVITGNTVSGNLGLGIALDRVGTPAGHGTLIEGNTVSFNGSHGIDVYANNTIVEGNIVSGNGRLVEGSSGIHVYARTPTEGYGRDNLISHNVSYGNLDSGGNDGIGILLDHYTRGNRVESNFAFSNDGAGIGIHGAANNTLTNNTLFGNLLDRGDSHTVVAELLINSNPALGEQLTRGNVITDNTVLSTHANGPALYVDVESAPLRNVFDGNIWQNPFDGPLVQDGSLTLSTAAALAASARHGGDSVSGITLADAPVGPLEHDLNGLHLILDGRPAELEGWDSAVGLVGDWLL